MTGPIRVALVDDQSLVLMGLATLIRSEDDLELVGEAHDGRAGLSLLRRTHPDVEDLIEEVSIDGMCGVY